MENKQMDKRRPRTDDRTQKTNKGFSHSPAAKDQQKTNVDTRKSKSATSFNEQRPDLNKNKEWEPGQPVTGLTDKRDPYYPYTVEEGMPNTKNQKINPINPDAQRHPQAQSEKDHSAMERNPEDGHYSDTITKSTPDTRYDKTRKWNEETPHTDVLDEHLEGNTERENQFGKSTESDQRDSHSSKKKNQAPPSNFS